MTNVLVTGGLGFIGSHVADLLCEQNYNVIIIDNLSTGQEKFLNNKAELVKLDICDAKIEDVFVKNKIDYIFHFAAQANVKFSTDYPDADAQANIMGSINIFKMAKKYKVKKIILASTAAVYGKPQYLPVDEKHEVSTLSCYGLSKYTMEQYAKLMDINYLVLRFSNVYGPRQSAKGEAGVVAIFADRMINNELITIDGDGEQTRDFIYVRDVANACLLAIKSQVLRTTINISTSQSISINELFNNMAMLYEYNKTPVYGQSRLGDIKHSVLDNKKASEKLGFHADTDIETGLKLLAQAQIKA